MGLLIYVCGNWPVKVNLLSPDIYEIEEFITLDQQKNILSYCKGLDEDKWWNSGIVDKEGFFNGKTSFEENIKLFDDIYQKINSLFSSLEYTNPLNLHRHLDGHFMSPHLDWHEGKTPHIRYGLVLYYNDDYQGGALNYPNLGIIHKPKARSLLIHGARILHGTTRSIGPARYFSTTFIFGTKEIPVILSDDVFKDFKQSSEYEYF